MVTNVLGVVAAGLVFAIKFPNKSPQSAVPEFHILLASSGVVTILFGQEMASFYRNLAG